jgi:hypothetical protein
MAVDKRKAKRRLEELLMNVSRYQSYLEAYRNRGDTSGVARCERLLDLHYSSIREHCAEHDLELPHGVPSESAE